MRLPSSFLFAAILSFFTSCGDQNKDNPVVSKRYIHKYGYAVSKEEWEARNYPGQVVTTLRDGVTVTTAYEHGILHGPCTYTYPHSQVIETYFLYNNGNLVKEIKYDRHGMPIREEIRVSPSRYTVTTWYLNGSPLNVEEYSGDELIEGHYFSVNNETESRVDKGTGQRVMRNTEGLLLSRDKIEKGYLVYRETFYSTGIPESNAHYYFNQYSGLRNTFSKEGEPISIEEWKNGKLHGLVTYFENGVKQNEVSFLGGQRNGTERHYIDGEIISQEISWENDKRHGPSVYYIDGQTRTEWFYDGSLVSYRRFAELDRLDEMISHISPESALGNTR